ncbi:MULTISPECIES: DUF2017 family protein [Actinomycetaceae]|uniref:DUF2017 family protein n=2 Tax=Actinomycetaceae TaxID=2049 RepID=UPI001C99754A|nr:MULTISPECIES: DUF2017 family protein [Actinomycetaceae]MDU4287158.1 DUF2017 family protein [Actinomyces sp.]
MSLRLMLLSEFRSTPGGYETTIDEDVAVLMQTLLGETILILDAPTQEPLLSALLSEDERDEPDDPTLKILLPSMSSDPGEASNLRALTEDALRTLKTERLQIIGRKLAELAASESRTFTIEREDVWQWLSGLNDLRLVLAGRLEVNSPDDTQYWYERAAALLAHDSAKPRKISAEELVGLVFVLVSWWQDSLLQAVQEGDSASNL